VLYVRHGVFSFCGVVLFTEAGRDREEGAAAFFLVGWVGSE